MDGMTHSGRQNNVIFLIMYFQIEQIFKDLKYSNTATRK